MSFRMSRHQYADMFGPTVGDQVRLGDTELFIEVEKITPHMVMKLNLVEEK